MLPFLSKDEELVTLGDKSVLFSFLTFSVFCGRPAKFLHIKNRKEEIYLINKINKKGDSSVIPKTMELGWRASLMECKVLATDADLTFF